MPWLARVTFRFPANPLWLAMDPEERKKHSMRRWERELVKGSVTEVFEIAVPFIKTARYYEKAFPPQWIDESEHERVRWGR